MTDNYDPFPDLGGLLDAALRAGRDGTCYAERIADRIGLEAWAGPEAAERALREALGVPGPADADQPLTCARCWHAPASRLLVVHWRTETLRLLCGGCAVTEAAEARDLPGFRMATVLTIGSLSPQDARTVTPGQAGPGSLTVAVKVYYACCIHCEHDGESDPDLDDERHPNPCREGCPAVTAGQVAP